MNIHDIKDTAKNFINRNTHNLNDDMNTVKKETIQSGKDWVSYIKEHPIQSIFFGIIAYYSVKGMKKN